MVCDEVVRCQYTPFNFLGDQVGLLRADISDLIARFQTGAYGLTANANTFRNHPTPTEVQI